MSDSALRPAPGDRRHQPRGARVARKGKGPVAFHVKKQGLPPPTLSTETRHCTPSHDAISAAPSPSVTRLHTNDRLSRATGHLVSHVIQRNPSPTQVPCDIASAGAMAENPDLYHAGVEVCGTEFDDGIVCARCATLSPASAVSPAFPVAAIPAVSAAPTARMQHRSRESDPIATPGCCHAPGPSSPLAWP